MGLIEKEIYWIIYDRELLIREVIDGNIVEIPRKSRHDYVIGTSYTNEITGKDRECIKIEITQRGRQHYVVHFDNGEEHGIYEIREYFKREKLGK